MKNSVLVALIIFWTVAVGTLVWWLAQSEDVAETGSETPTENVEPTGPILTRAELVKHNSPTSCWLLISGNVYDVTDFIPLHPGGADRILMNCGKDATKAFETQGGEGQHSSTANQTLAAYKLGKLTQ